MQSTLLKNSAFVLLVLTGVWGTVSAVFGFSAVVTIAFVFAALLLIGGFAFSTRQLTHLNKTAESILRPAGEPVSNNSFENIKSATKLRNFQLDRAQEQLADNQERFDAVLSGMAEGIIAIDASGQVLFVNRVAREILGIPATEVVSRPLIGLVRYDVVQKAIQQALETTKTVTEQFETLGSARRDVIMRAAPMAGIPTPGITLVFRDVTEINRLENMRRDFVANVSHELKTPLAAIKAYAETLSLGAIDREPENRQFVEQIEHQANQLNHQIQDLLQIARIESKQESLQLETIDANETCRKCADKFQFEAGQHQVKLVVELHNDSLWVHADSEALDTVVENLVSNAIHYSKAETVSIKTRMIDVNCFCIEVSDTGIGIASEHHQRIFERFYRVDKARSREMGGTGLGLAIVKHLVQSLDGSLELESKPGFGSQFQVILPLAEKK